jgi:hypothetical protein
MLSGFGRDSFAQPFQLTNDILLVNKARADPCFVTQFHPDIPCQSPFLQVILL